MGSYMSFLKARVLFRDSQMTKLLEKVSWVRVPYVQPPYSYFDFIAYSAFLFKKGRN